MLTQDDKNKLLELVRDDTDGSEGFYYVSQMVQSLSSERSTVDVNITPEDGESYLNESLWSLVSIAAVAKVNDVNINDSLIRDTAIVTARDMVVDKYSEDTLDTIRNFELFSDSRTLNQLFTGLIQQTEIINNVIQTGEPLQQTAFRGSDLDTPPQAPEPEPRQEPEPEATPEPTPQPTPEPEVNFDVDENIRTISFADSTSLRQFYQANKEKLFDDFEKRYNFKIRRAKTELDTRRMPSTENLVNFLDQKVLSKIIPELWEKETIGYEDIEETALVAKAVIEVIEFAQSNGLSKVQVFDGFAYIIFRDGSTQLDGGAALIYGFAQQILGQTLFLSSVLNRSGQLIKSLKLSLQNQQADRLYLQVVEDIAVELLNQASASEDEEAQKVEINKFLDKFNRLESFTRLENDIKRLITHRLKIQEFESTKKIIGEEALKDIGELTIRGF